MVFVRGKLDKREDVPRLMGMELSVPDLSNSHADAPIVISIPSGKITPPLVARLGEVLTHHKGNTEVRLRLEGARRTTVLRLDRHRSSPTRPSSATSSSCSARAAWRAEHGPAPAVSGLPGPSRGSQLQR